MTGADILKFRWYYVKNADDPQSESQWSASLRSIHSPVQNGAIAEGMRVIMKPALKMQSQAYCEQRVSRKKNESTPW
jgi:hypothetical protein